MILTGKITGSDRLDDAITRLGGMMREGIPEATRQAARGFVRREIAITPPASDGSTGLGARRQGERKIDRELARVFVPVPLKHKRREQYPDVEAIYQQEVYPRKGKRGLSARPLGQRYHVDQQKFNALRESLVGNIGLLASGWNAAAGALGVPVPAWIARHGLANGACEVLIEENRIVIVLTNAVSYARDVDGYDRRTRAALDYQAQAFEREIGFLLEKSVQAAGLR